jgi:hypothetical protein
MNTFTPQQHQAALVRRRIKFVVEKGAMARLFRGGTHAELQDELFRLLQPTVLAKASTPDEYDHWLTGTIELPCWAKYSRNGLEADRWAYFAKLINIVIYEIVSNRELFSEEDWRRIRPLLHLPIDANVLIHLERLDPSIPKVLWLKRMQKEQYLAIQYGARRMAQSQGVPTIWYEAAWTA